MPLPHDNTPSEKHIRSRLRNLDLNHDITIEEEPIVEEFDESPAMGGKRGVKRGPQLCGKCRQPRKGHVCPYATKKQNPRYEKREKETKDTQIQTIEESFLLQKRKRQRGNTQMDGD